MNELINQNKTLMEKIIIDSQENKKRLQEQPQVFLREIQDIIFYNRNNSMFIPKFIRKRFLKPGNPFYEKLNEVKSVYLDNSTTSFPSSADEILIWNTDETSTINLTDIHNRLRKMLDNVSKAFETANINYTLDGGTLIGAFRNPDYIPDKIQNKKELPDNYSEAVNKGEGSFIFWDDDVDIAIEYHDLEIAKNIIKNILSDEYEIQDYESDPYYSPRLSNFRIREKNNKSIVTEKDSEFYREYKSRGVFLDIYALGPIFVNKKIDSVFRYLMIHPINRRIARIEKRYPTTDKKDKIQRSFLRWKARYIKRVKWYTAHAKNDSYYSYVPNYIDNLKKAGPYIKKEYLYNGKKRKVFEGMSLPIPADSERVLTACYGKWYENPFISKKELQRRYDQKWFSHKCFSASVLKHLDHIDLFEG